MMTVFIRSLLKLITCPQAGMHVWKQNCTVNTRATLCAMLTRSVATMTFDTFLKSSCWSVTKIKASGSGTSYHFPLKFAPVVVMTFKSSVKSCM